MTELQGLHVFNKLMSNKKNPNEKKIKKSFETHVIFQERKHGTSFEIQISKIFKHLLHQHCSDLKIEKSLNIKFSSVNFASKMRFCKDLDLHIFSK